MYNQNIYQINQFSNISVHKSFNRLDRVMKDASKDQKKTEIFNGKLNMTLKNKPTDHNIKKLMEPFKVRTK